MATKKITDLQLRDEVTDDLSIPSDDGIQSYRVTGSQLKSYVLAAGNVLKATLATVVQNALTPTGAVIAYAGGTAPSGFLHCDGSAVSRTTYADLYAAIGDAHGNGDGTTTFNLPDYRGRFLRGWSSGQTTDPDRASRTAMATGGATGDNIGSVQGHAFQTHTHTQNQHAHGPLTDGWFVTSAGVGGQTVNAGSAALSWNYRTTTGNTTATNQNAAASGATAQASSSETRPVNAYVMYCIKT